MRTLRILLVLAVPIVLLSAAVSAWGLPLLQIPEVPHPVEGREDCLACHDTGGIEPFPEDHAGRTSDVCTMCHEAGESEVEAEEIPPVPHPVDGREDCLACHDTDGIEPFPEDHAGRTSDTCTMCHETGGAVVGAEAIPNVPHSVEGREDCLMCHDTGQVRPFPADHEGRGSDTCLGCHQLGAGEAPEPTPALPPSLEIVPTPIHEPVMFEENTCISCHQGLGGRSEQITADWSESIHAQRGVGCVSCHGGDPTQADAEEAMSPAAGYLGPLPKERIPGLCGSCHTRVDLMRPFDLATDQLAQYWQSQHGQALLEGDPNVATCFDCHDRHRVLKVSDPSSQVYPTNEPAMCAACHADEELMAPYGIPTNQYALYQDSVHGIALLENQDLRAPTCSTCHGTHGAAPPGFQEVANVCGQCHSVTEDYYLAGAHKSGMVGEAAPRCVTCHGRYDVPPATRDLFLGTEERHCGSCHAPGSPIAAQVDAIYQTLNEASEALDEAEATVTQATETRLIMAEQEEQLQQARTPLIEARALQHTVDVEQVQAKTEGSLQISHDVQASAEAKLDELDTRRLAMVIVVAVVLVTVLALVLIKRQLDRDLEARRARENQGS
jgi:pyruvate/2-oxoglutarate dehydrogenase complex dihydrolipoamide acyltransferase (E2) component